MSSADVGSLFFAFIFIAACFAVTGLAGVMLLKNYTKFKDLKFYLVWNTFIYEMNPKYAKPPMYNFLYMIKSFVFALWIAAMANSNGFEAKFSIILIMQLVVSLVLQTNMFFSGSFTQSCAKLGQSNSNTTFAFLMKFAF